MMKDAVSPAPAESPCALETGGLRPTPRANGGVTIVNTAAGYRAGLSPRERQVFEMVLAGHPSKIIAADLGISQRTVEHHRAAVMKKTKARSLPELGRLSLVANAAPASDRFDIGPESHAGIDAQPISEVGLAMFEYAENGMILLDHADLIRHINPAAEILFGHCSADLIGKRIDTLLPAGIRDHRSHPNDPLQSATTTRQIAAGRRLTARHKNGHDIVVTAGLRPLPAGAGSAIALLSITEYSIRDQHKHVAATIFTGSLGIFCPIGGVDSDLASFQPAVAMDEGRGAWVRDLVRAQLALFNGRDMAKIRITGSDLRLRAGPTEYLGLAVRELAANVVTQGAVSAEDGAIEIVWRADPSGRIFHFDWIGHRGAADASPTGNTFRSVILQYVVPSALGGVATLRGAPQGVTWHLEAPLATISHDACLA